MHFSTYSLETLGIIKSILIIKNNKNMLRIKNESLILLFIIKYCIGKAYLNIFFFNILLFIFS